MASDRRKERAMKASKMTNEELAARLEKVLPGNYYIVEAVERLRKMVDLTPEMTTEICRRESTLRTKLKVAESALAQIASYSCICESDRIAEKAIAAIRAK